MAFFYAESFYKPNGACFEYTISYSLTTSTGSATLQITGVTVKSNWGGYGTWALTPTLYFFMIPDMWDDPKNYQKDSTADGIIKCFTSQNGVYTSEKTNKPPYPNSNGGSLSWGPEHYSLTLNLNNTGSTDKTVNVTIGVTVRNTDGNTNFDNAYDFKHVLAVKIPAAYTSPSNLSLSTNNVTTTSFTVSATWTNGVGSDARAYVKIGNGAEQLINDSPVIFTGLTPNTSYTITGRLADNVNPNASYDTASTSVTTIPAAPSGWISSGSNANSIWATANSSNGGNFKYQYQIQKNGSWSGWQDSNTFSGLSSNTNYNIQARVVSNTTGIITGSIDGSVWTYPVVSVLNVSLVSGQEHDAINANASIAVSSGNDSYRFRIDSNYTSWQGSNASWSGLTGNTTYTIGVTVRNNVSGLQSDEVTRTITTWYDPISSLSVNLVNRWFWYLSINCTVNYQGGIGNITKYEFDIGNQGYQNKGTTNAHSRGSTSSNGADKLDYNTNYTCKVRVTDNHGRTKEASATFKTLDERPLYVDGILREVKLIKPDGSIHYITPNLLSVITSSGQVINMNKIINNDDRKEYN